MMRDEDVKNILIHVEDKLVHIKNAHYQSLQDQEIPADLRIDIKNVMEKVRSTLDYMAQDVNETIIIPL